MWSYSYDPQSGNEVVPFGKSGSITQQEQKLSNLIIVVRGRSLKFFACTITTVVRYATHTCGFHQCIAAVNFVWVAVLCCVIRWHGWCILPLHRSIKWSLLNCVWTSETQQQIIGWLSGTLKSQILYPTLQHPQQFPKPGHSLITISTSLC